MNFCKESSRASIHSRVGLISPDSFHIEGRNEQWLSTIGSEALFFFNNIPSNTRSMTLLLKRSCSMQLKKLAGHEVFSMWPTIWHSLGFNCFYNIR